MLAATRVLVVDDNAHMRQLFVDMMECMEDVDLTVVTNGREAVAAATAGSFDTVFLDVNLSDMDGVSVAAQIRDIAPDTFVYLMTGDITDLALRNPTTSLLTTVAGILAKPFRIEEVLELIETCRERQPSPADVD